MTNIRYIINSYVSYFIPIVMVWYGGFCIGEVAERKHLPEFWFDWVYVGLMLIGIISAIYLWKTKKPS
jgi:membrane protein DedA with SNARE-associated domain